MAIRAPQSPRGRGLGRTPVVLLFLSPHPWGWQMSPLGLCRFPSHGGKVLGYWTSASPQSRNGSIIFGKQI